MNDKRYVDIPATIQVLGGLYLNTSILDKDEYFFLEADFPSDFHRIIFASIYNLHELGAEKVTLRTIEDYLKDRPQSLAIYQASKGREWLESIKDNIEIQAFDYYYNRLKKMTLLRQTEKSTGMDLSWLYDPDNIFDSKKKERQEAWLDSTSLEDIFLTINAKIENIKLTYVQNANDVATKAGDGGLELFKDLKKNPEFGYPLYGKYINTILRGARLKKFYLWSAATGVGKSRSMVAHTCSIGCDELYNKETRKWEQNGTKEPVLFITTEQEFEEIQTMMWAFIADVEEEHIIEGKCTEDEEERVLYAIKLLTECPIYIQQLPDFSLQDIENVIKRGVHDLGIKYIFHYYIHSSMKILSEISTKAKVKGLREDNILFMISVRLKDLCNEYGIFIMSATQLNGDFKTAETLDQNVLRGAKSIADKIDAGVIMVDVSPSEKETIKPICDKLEVPIPDIKMSVYKNRRGRWKGILLWCQDRRGVCKIDPLFVTDYGLNVLDIVDKKIHITSAMESKAF